MWKLNSIEWPRHPITVAVALDPEMEGPARKALETINDVAGCAVFIEVPHGADVLILRTPLIKSFTLGAIVYVGFGNSTETYLVTMHELGHVLGLAHQTYGIMREDVQDLSTNIDRAKPLPSFDDWQAAGIRMRYCR